jgi:predicted O-methyltransferase YrrM
MNRKAARVLRALARAPDGPVVEVGCIRHEREVATDGFSTLYLARACAERGRSFASYDLDRAAVERAQAVLKRADLPGAVRCEDAVPVLRRGPPLAFLYLDSSDVPADSMAQFLAAPLLPGALLAVDDAQAYGGHALGKATEVARALDAAGLRYRVHPTEPGYAMLVARFPRGKPSGQLPAAPGSALARLRERIKAA